MAISNQLHCPQRVLCVISLWLPQWHHIIIVLSSFTFATKFQMLIIQWHTWSMSWAMLSWNIVLKWAVIHLKVIWRKLLIMWWWCRRHARVTWKYISKSARILLVKRSSEPKICTVKFRYVGRTIFIKLKNASFSLDNFKDLYLFS